MEFDVFAFGSRNLVALLFNWYLGQTDFFFFLRKGTTDLIHMIPITFGLKIRSRDFFFLDLTKIVYFTKINGEQITISTPSISMS